MRELGDAFEDEWHERRGGALLDDARVGDEDLLEHSAVHQPLVAALPRGGGELARHRVEVALALLGVLARRRVRVDTLLARVGLEGGRPVDSATPAGPRHRTASRPVRLLAARWLGPSAKGSQVPGEPAPGRPGLVGCGAARTGALGVRRRAASSLSSSQASSMTGCTLKELFLKSSAIWRTCQGGGRRSRGVRSRTAPPAWLVSS